MGDYYKILDVPKNATDDQIKRAYRKMALKWHPDKNQNRKEEANERFKEISEAYEVLIDPQKRSVYDQYGKAGFNGGGGRSSYHDNFGDHGFGGGFQFQFHDPEDIFRSFFEHDPFGDDILGQFFGHPGHSRGRRAAANRQNDPFAGFRSGFHSFSFDDAFPAHQNSQSFFSSSFSSGMFNGNGAGRVSSKSTSQSTRIVNGRQISTTKIVENGRETVEVHENGVLKSRTVNGTEMLNGGQPQGRLR